jgi:hypothetical protein
MLAEVLIAAHVHVRFFFFFIVLVIFCFILTKGMTLAMHVGPSWQIHPLYLDQLVRYSY